MVSRKLIFAGAFSLGAFAGVAVAEHWPPPSPPAPPAQPPEPTGAPLAAGAPAPR
jgi:hypothetical protein